MYIKLNKFGTTLTSRQAGQEALAAFRPSLREIPDDEKLNIDFSGVNTFSPSWADEFLTPLMNEYKSRIFLKKTDNLSVVETLSLLEKIHGYEFEFMK